jgi:hypothetical protein
MKCHIENLNFINRENISINERLQAISTGIRDMKKYIASDKKQATKQAIIFKR